MAPASESGLSFRVVDADHRTVFSAAVGGDQGTWSASYPFVYALDFNAVQRPGAYRIEVDAPADATSPLFRIDTAANLYASPMANALSFYENERDGANFIPSGLRSAAGHLNDAHAMTYLIPTINSNDGFAGDLTPLGTTINASGAWWDAGDYLKFVETDSYVVAMMETAVRDFPAQLGEESASSNFRAEAAFGLDFLTRMWDDSTRSLYIQVGIRSLGCSRPSV
jgi:endoglucanase